ncbi:unnamed protein product, partial [Ixodes hexagonus]
ESSSSVVSSSTSSSEPAESAELGTSAILEAPHVTVTTHTTSEGDDEDEDEDDEEEEDEVASLAVTPVPSAGNVSPESATLASVLSGGPADATEAEESSEQEEEKEVGEQEDDVEEEEDKTLDFRDKDELEKSDSNEVVRRMIEQDDEPKDETTDETSAEEEEEDAGNERVDEARAEGAQVSLEPKVPELFDDNEVQEEESVQAEKEDAKSSESEDEEEEEDDEKEGDEDKEPKESEGELDKIELPGDKVRKEDNEQDEVSEEKEEQQKSRTEISEVNTLDTTSVTNEPITKTPSQSSFLQGPKTESNAPKNTVGATFQQERTVPAFNSVPRNDSQSEIRRPTTLVGLNRATEPSSPLPKTPSTPSVTSPTLLSPMVANRTALPYVRQCALERTPMEEKPTSPSVSPLSPFSHPSANSVNRIASQFAAAPSPPTSEPARRSRATHSAIPTPTTSIKTDDNKVPVAALPQTIVARRQRHVIPVPPAPVSPARVPSVPVPPVSTAPVSAFQDKASSPSAHQLPAPSVSAVWVSQVPVPHVTPPQAPAAPTRTFPIPAPPSSKVLPPQTHVVNEKASFIAKPTPVPSQRPSSLDVGKDTANKVSADTFLENYKKSREAFSKSDSSGHVKSPSVLAAQRTLLATETAHRTPSQRTPESQKTTAASAPLKEPVTNRFQKPPDPSRTVIPVPPAPRRRPAPLTRTPDNRKSGPGVPSEAERKFNDLSKANKKPVTKFIGSCKDIDSFLKYGDDEEPETFEQFEDEFEKGAVMPLPEPKKPSPGDRVKLFIGKFQDIDEMLGTTAAPLVFPLSPSDRSPFEKSASNAPHDSDSSGDSSLEEVKLSSVRVHESKQALRPRLDAYTEEIDSSAVRIREPKVMQGQITKRPTRKLDDCTLQLYKFSAADSDYGSYLDLESTIDEQSDDFEGFQDK